MMTDTVSTIMDDGLRLHDSKPYYDFYDISPDGRPPCYHTLQAIWMKLVRFSARALTHAAKHTAHDQSNVKSVRHAHSHTPAPRSADAPVARTGDRADVRAATVHVA